MLQNTLTEFSEQAERLAEVKDDIEQAEEAIRVYRERIAHYEEENDAYLQRYEQQESIMEDLKQDMQQLLNYKSDLEKVLEEQTQMLESRNKRLHQVDE